MQVNIGKHAGIEITLILESQDIINKWAAIFNHAAVNEYLGAISLHKELQKLKTETLTHVGDLNEMFSRSGK